MIPACSAWIDGTTAEALIALRRDTEALTALERARAAREILIKANPAVTRNREQLIRVHRQTRRHSPPGRADGRTRWRHSSKGEGLGELGQRPPGGPRLPARTRCSLRLIIGELLSVDGQDSEVAETARPSDLDSSSDDPRQSLDSRGPTQCCANTLRLRGIVLTKCGRPAEAVSAFPRFDRGLEGAVERLRPLTITTSPAQSLLSGIASQPGSGLTAAEGQAEADHAMEALRQAVAAGWRDASVDSGRH